MLSSLLLTKMKEYNIKTNEPAVKLERLAALSEDRCPVGRLFADAGFEPECVWTALPLPD